MRGRWADMNARPIIFALVVLSLLFIMRSDANITRGFASVDNSSFHFDYVTIPGYFMQSEFSTNATEFDFKKQNFGLINQTYDTDPDHTDSKDPKDQWRRFEKYVRHVNDQSKDDVQYKVIFLGRHGQGFHNVAESKYGTVEWDCYWSMLDGADGIIWADAHLTEKGQGQALDAHALWKSLLPNGIPTPDAYYVSPLTRAIQTADLSFQGLDLPDQRQYKPVVKERLREVIGVHTCDRRSTRCQIHEAFPHVVFEKGFSEEDPLWTSDFREPRLARRYRLATLLDDVFAHDDGVFLSFTSHSGAIESILEAIGHRQFDLETGGVIPVFVKGQKVAGPRESPPDEPSEAPPPCPSSPAALAN